MLVVDKKVEDLIPYDKNPRRNENAVQYVKESIREFGFKVPIVIDKDNVIIAGHTRLLGAIELGLETVPCVIADDLTEEQVKAFRLADNKVSEFAQWDFDLLEAELEGIIDINMSDFGFVLHDDIDWAGVEDLDDDTYEAPVKDMLECPHCHHIDSKNHFKKVDGVEEAEKMSDEE